MDKFIKALVAAALIASVGASPAHAEKKGGSVGGGCSLGSAHYAEGAVVGLLKCKGGKWVLNADLPRLPLPKVAF